MTIYYRSPRRRTPLPHPPYLLFYLSLDNLASCYLSSACGGQWCSKGQRQGCRSLALLLYGVGSLPGQYWLNKWGKIAKHTFGFLRRFLWITSIATVKWSVPKNRVFWSVLILLVGESWDSQLWDKTFTMTSLTRVMLEIYHLCLSFYICTTDSVCTSLGKNGVRQYYRSYPGHDGSASW